MEAEEGTFQQKLWVATEGQWGDSKEEKRIVSHCLQMVGSDHARHWAMGVHHLHLTITLARSVYFMTAFHTWGNHGLA